MFAVIEYTSDKLVGYSVAEFSKRKDAEEYIKNQSELLHNLKNTFIIKEV